MESKDYDEIFLHTIESLFRMLKAAKDKAEAQE